MNPNLEPQRPKRSFMPLLVAAFLAASGLARLPEAVAGEMAPAELGGGVPGADSLGALGPGTPAGSLFTGFS